jgi:hypothetical protein
MNKISDKDIWTTIGLFTANDIRRMLDVEFISELSIGLLHGLQNKKDNLDKYYQAYEEDFEEQNLVEESFDTILGEITKILPEIRKTRWNKKSDFYTLFLVFSNHIDDLPLSKDKRANAKELLIGFGNEIDLYVKTNKEESEEEFDFSEHVKTYFKGIRATTDLGSRKNRAQALEAELAQAF